MQSSFTPYLSISASAGSGKTFQLAHRVLRLLAMGVSPDRIGAYTFSRKAAGEIFDEIVRYLREAAGDEEKARATSAHMGLAHSREGFMENLRAMLAHMNRLRIGTLDSRIAQMLSAAAVEMQLPAEFSLLDGQGPEARFLHEQVVDRLFRPGRLQPDAEQAFLHAFEQATHGLSEKAFDRKLLNFVQDHRAVYLLHPDESAWDHPGPLLISDLPRAIPDAERELLRASLLAELPEVEHDKVREALEGIIHAAADYNQGSSWSKGFPKSTLVAHLLEGDSPEVTYRRKEVPLPENLWRGLRLLLRHPAGLELERAFTQTKGLHRLLHRFEDQYRKNVLPKGRITFEDACALMNGFNHLTPGELAFRLDGQVDHWLLDEFQDTSTLQWRAIEPFVEEVLQDAEGRRGYFQVGDVKQAIYAWRGGNADLFEQVLARYPVIQNVHMETSQRSAPPVLDLVNLLMDGIPEGEEFPAEAGAHWNREYRRHTAAERNRDLPGFAQVVEIRDKEETEAVDVIEAILRGQDPSLETAILTRSNSSGAELADALRSRGFAVALEGQSPLRTDTAVEILLAGLKYAAHPADDFSRQFLAMADFEVRPFEVLQALHQHGFAHTLHDLSEKLTLGADAEFARFRIEKLVEAAREFDDLDTVSVDRFLSFVDGYRLKEHQAAGVIRIMTIHQSKGLGFDVVFLPVDAGSNFVRLDHKKLATSATGEAPDWVLDFPPKAVCAQTGGLAEVQDRLEAESAYENLCNLYVALTRAKQGLHVILPEAPKAKGKLTVTANWIRDRMPDAEPSTEGREPEGTRVLYAVGTPVLPPKKEKQEEGPAEIEALALCAGQKIIPRLEPSQADQTERELGRVYRLIPEDGRELGSRVHGLLEQMAWADEETADELLARCGEPPDSAAAEQVRRVFVDFPVLRKPEGVRDIWREKHFESVLPEGWITGVFDRVVLFENAAWIQDYKTNRKSDEATVAHYAPQMKLYRRVLADMLDLPPANIRCQLLFTRTGETREIDAST